MCALRRGFTVPLAKKGRPGDDDPGPSSLSGGTEGADSEDEDYGIRQQRQAHHGSGSLPLTSGRVSPPPASNQLGYTIDLDREFGGDVRALWGFRTLNHVQSACFPVCFQTDHNVVIAAPTGVGKTFLFELAIVRLIQEAKGSGEGSSRKPWKIVYVAPSKALCQQRLLDWQARFSKFGIRCVEVTGDNSGLRDMAASQLILTTPEKFDAVSRDWRDNLFLLGSIRLFLIDEAHTLGDDPRGATLEALVCRLKIIRTNRQVVERGLPATKMRILAASATLPNVEDIGVWLGCPPESRFNFDYTYRPVPLDVHVLGYASCANPFLFNRHLEERVLDVITKYSDGKSTLVFCESKKACESLAYKLAAAASALASRQSMAAKDRFSGVANPKLRDLLSTGDGQVAFHHAGIMADDRACVERLFQQGQIRVLCSTSTLAVGINTPAHLVVIKGTTMWRGAGIGYEDMPVSSVLQMIGRAGRPGFDDRGVAVIMTSKDKQQLYETMSAGQELVESQLPKRLHEVLNAEICSRVVADLDDALSWLQSTFLWVRMQQNPRHYKDVIPAGRPGEDVEARLRAALLKVLHDLDAEEVARFSDEDLSVGPLVAGKVMSKTLISFETMKVLRALPADASLEELLWACCRCNEMSLPVRKADKRPLNDLLAKCRFRSKFKRCQLPSHKAFVLVQAALAGGGAEVQDFTLRVEQETILDNLQRIARAHQDYAVETDKGAGAYVSLLLGRSLRARMWEEEREAVLRQVEGVGPTIMSKLAAGGIKGFHEVLAAPPVRLEALAGRRHPFGHELQHRVATILGNSLIMSVCQEGRARDTATLVVELRRDPDTSTSTGASAAADVLGAGAGASGGRGGRRLHYTLVAFSSGPDRRLLLFRDINFCPPPSAVQPVSASKETEEEEEGEAEPLHRIKFRVPHPCKQEGGETGDVRGADKRFRITLALVSPFIPLDCLQIFYPDFEGGGGHYAGYGVEMEDGEHSGGGGGGGNKKRKQPKKQVKQSVEDDSPGSIAASFKRQQQLLEQRAKEEAEQRLVQEQAEAEQRTRAREERNARQRHEQEMAALRKAKDEAEKAAAGVHAPAPASEPYRSLSSSSSATATALPLQRQQHEQRDEHRETPSAPPQPQVNRQQQRRQQQHEQKQPPPPPTQQAGDAYRPRQQQAKYHAEQPRQPPASIPPAPRVRNGGGHIFEQFRFTPQQHSPLWDLVMDGPGDADEGGGASQRGLPASMHGPSSSSSSLSNSSASSYRSNDTAVSSLVGSSSFRSAAVSASPSKRRPAATTPRRSAGEASTSEIFIIKAKAREAHTDQMPINRIGKPAAPSSTPTSRSAAVGPIFSHKVVGSSARAPRPAPTPQQLQHQSQPQHLLQQLPPCSTPPSSMRQQPQQDGFHGRRARYSTGTGVVLGACPAPRHAYGDDEEEMEGQNTIPSRDLHALSARFSAPPFRTSLHQQQPPPRHQQLHPPAAMGAPPRVSWDASIAAGGAGSTGQRRPSPPAPVMEAKKARVTSSNSGRYPLAPRPVLPSPPPNPHYYPQQQAPQQEEMSGYYAEHMAMGGPEEEEEGSGAGVADIGEGPAPVSFDSAGFF